MSVATWIGSNSLREFQARKVRVIPIDAEAPSCTTSMEIGSTAKASGVRSSAAGMTTEKGASAAGGDVAQGGLGHVAARSSPCVRTPSRRARYAS